MDWSRGKHLALKPGAVSSVAVTSAVVGTSPSVVQATVSGRPRVTVPPAVVGVVFAQLDSRLVFAV